MTQSLYRNVNVTDPNKFMKILIKCGVGIEELTNYKWYITQVGLAKYECNGYHPVASRILIIKDNIVIH